MIADSTLFKIIAHVVAIPTVAFVWHMIFSKHFYKKGYRHGYVKGWARRQSIREMK